VLPASPDSGDKDLIMPDSVRPGIHPPPLRSELTVQDMSAVGDEVWAVGRAGFPGPALIAHSAGGAPWQLPSYSTSSEARFTDLAGVYAISGADVWGVGSDEAPSRMHVAHHDGSAWRLEASPGGADNSHLSAVAAAGRDDALAVGSRRPVPSPTSPALPPLAVWETLALRWDGARWASVPAPARVTGY
jgi:hypothetical protein